MTVRLGIGAESPTDVRRVTGLVDRLILQDIDWITPDLLDACRRWSGLDGASFLPLPALAEARRRRLPIYGHFGARPGEVEAAAFRAALLLFASDPPAAVVLVRDDDGKGRASGAEQAIRDRQWPFQVVIAIPVPEIEAWMCAAWREEGEGDRSALEVIRRRLGFEPHRHPEQLTAGKESDKRDAKRALAELCAQGRAGDDRWEDVPLEHLEEVGRSCGLTEFIHQVRTALIPEVRGRAPLRE